ncbi:pyridoxine-5'-phosphate oxidase isoform X3 [Daktulosphaira vitifoliae]|uniref:pyridoxine-5'-phosphate oxidase isoform X3 n=1 Tax=Daktulosphaira vitifoliae TaxID=58002 RepID=UPI0021AAF37A|nr:pyridoxine-5'-phosphate oxidase isoform X3 [Daktulosphaira vitifoliae]
MTFSTNSFKQIVRRLFINLPRMADSNFAQKRVAYRSNDDLFLEENLESKDPIKLFSSWFQNASECSDVRQPNAACLATATKNGIPSARFVLLKSYDEYGFTFYTNSCSRKGRELEENPVAALTIYWDPLNRSVRIEGPVVKVSESESNEYFRTRPRSSQIGAHVSHQSSVIPNRDTLKKLTENIIMEFENKDVPRPSYWNGYKILPHNIEFWQGQSDRLHDRIKFVRSELAGEYQSVCKLGENGWAFYRLSP